MKRALLFLSALGYGAFAASILMRRGRRTKQTASGLIDLNSASEKELLQLKGIGEVFAARIVENRPYANKLDLVGRRVVPVAAYEMIKDAITANRAA
jgi:DNA uptake protein ComE-like DNA-binding protein